MAPRRPFYDLEQVKAVAHRPDGLLLKKTKALDSFPTFARAHAEARRTLTALNLKDFVETKQQRDLCDVYAVRRDNQGWYVKFTLMPEQLVLVSFHILEAPIRKASGHWVDP